MQGPHQRIGGDSFAEARLRQPGIDGFQMPPHLGAEDLQQHRIDRDNPRIRFGSGRRLFRGLDLRRRGLRHRRRRHDHVLARRQPVGDGFHRGNVDGDRAFPAQGGMQLR